MKNNLLKNQKGVTLISLVVAVIIILVITNAVIYNVRDNLQISKLEALQNDIQNLRDKVLNYYGRNGTYPARIKYTQIGTLRSSGIISSVMDTGEFYVIDLSSLENLTLNFGKDYEKIARGEVTTESEAKSLKDIYIINTNSYNIFYVQGITIDGQTYYTDYTKEEVDQVGFE